MVVLKVVVEPGEDSGEKGLMIEEQKVEMVDGGKGIDVDRTGGRAWRWCWCQ